MTSYVPRHAKKRERLERLEADLQRLLLADAAPARLHKAAEAIRDATIRAIAARRAELPPTAEHADEIEDLVERMEVWREIETADIIAHHYRIVALLHR
jgi:hypothetical protein